MIEITQVKNGYIVRDNTPNANMSVNPAMVFQTMSELLKYIGEHFTHRNHEVLIDGPF
jgi:hypothetical protein